MRRQHKTQRTEDAIAQRQREDDAPRLREVVAHLRELRLRFRDVRDAGRHIVPPYSKVVAVGSAPAHFEIHCMEPSCDGRYDLTRSILPPLRASEQQFSGTMDCNGMVGDSPCDRVIAYSCEAVYD